MPVVLGAPDWSGPRILLIGVIGPFTVVLESRLGGAMSRQTFQPTTARATTAITTITAGYFLMSSIVLLTPALYCTQKVAGKFLPPGKAAPDVTVGLACRVPG